MLLLDREHVLDREQNEEAGVGTIAISFIITDCLLGLYNDLLTVVAFEVSGKFRAKAISVESVHDRNARPT